MDVSRLTMELAAANNFVTDWNLDAKTAAANLTAERTGCSGGVGKNAGSSGAAGAR